MQEKIGGPAANIAGGSELVGVLFCALAAWGGLEYAEHGLFVLVQTVLPAAGCGLLLIVAGRSLRAVSDDANATAEIRQWMRGQDR